MTPEQLATELRDLRMSRGLRQADLAAALDVDTSTVTHVERGSRQPGPDLLRAWLTACGARMVILRNEDDAALASLPEPHRSIARRVAELDAAGATLVLRFVRVFGRLAPPIREGIVSGAETMALLDRQ